MVFRVGMLAAKILQTILPCAEPLDCELNAVHPLVQAFWLNPPIINY
jgi:hypothetical protein